MAEVAEVAEEGKHYDISKSGKVLCKAPGCVSMLRDLAGYQRHACRHHNLKWRAPKRKRHRPGDPDSEDDTPAGRGRKRRRKQPGDAHCPHYHRQRGTVQARWDFINQRKKRQILRKAEEFIEERESMRPKAPKPTALTLVMEIALPKMGYEVWSFLLDKSEFDKVTEMLEESLILSMCTLLGPDLGSQCEDMVNGMRLLFARDFLTIIFDHGEKVISDGVNLVGHGELMIKETQEWMSQKAELLKFEKDFDANQIRRDALNKYEEWERTQKDTSVRNIRRLMLPQAVEDCIDNRDSSEHTSEPQGQTQVTHVPGVDRAQPFEHLARPFQPNEIRENEINRCQQMVPAQPNVRPTLEYFTFTEIFNQSPDQSQLLSREVDSVQVHRCPCPT